MSSTIGIVGFGFSGLMVAANIVRCATSPLTLYLVANEHSGRGLAYSTRYAEHLLNVRAGNMSAWAHEAGDFVQWLAQHHPHYGAGDFVPRCIFGEYLESIWQATQLLAAEKKIHLKLVPSEAVALEWEGKCFTLRTERGDAIALDRAVLATGNEMKPMPNPMLQFPWAADVLAELARKPGPIVLIGSGLTAVDVVLALRHEGYTGQLYALSRSGLFPKPHRDGVVPAIYPPEAVAGLHSLAQWMRWVRNQVRAAADWRNVIDGLRPHTQRVWQRMPLPAQQLFLKRLLTFWNVHRHRMAPQIAAQIDAELEAGTLQRITYKNLDSSMQAINCTGPELDLQRSRQPLLKQLLAYGLAERHATGLGITGDAHGRAWGKAYPNLYAIGALYTGQWLESTAVPELRVQAAMIGESIIDV